MKQVVWVRRIHKWLALAAGIQVSIWAVSGLYMTIVDLDIIHGDHLVKAIPQQAINEIGLSPVSSRIMADIAPVKAVKLVSYFGTPIYEITAHKKNTVIIDATTGEIKSDLTEQQVRQNVATVYAGDADIRQIEKLAVYPGEIGGRELPVWRVEFDDALNSTLYFHHSSGRLISKRTHLWRVFDMFWVLHIMDYMGSRSHRGYLFRIFSISSLLLAVFGTWLLIFRLKGESQP